MTWASRRVPREGFFGADREERGGNHLAAGGHAASRRACQPCTDFRRATFLASKIVGCSVGTPTHEILSEVLRFCAAFDANGKPREGGAAWAGDVSLLGLRQLWALCRLCLGHNAGEQLCKPQRSNSSPINKARPAAASRKSPATLTWTRSVWSTRWSFSSKEASDARGSPCGRRHGSQLTPPVLLDRISRKDANSSRSAAISIVANQSLNVRARRQSRSRLSLFLRPQFLL